MTPDEVKLLTPLSAFLALQLEPYLERQDATRLVDEVALNPLDVVDRILRLLEIDRLRGRYTDRETAEAAALVLSMAQLVENRREQAVERQGRRPSAGPRQLCYVLEDGFLLTRMSRPEREIFKSSTDAVAKRLQNLIARTATPWPDVSGHTYEAGHE